MIGAARGVNRDDDHGSQDTPARYPSIEPAHPGEVLAEIVIPGTGRRQMSRQTLRDILARRQPVTPTVAVKPGKRFGNGAGVWLRMQAEYGLWHAERMVDTPAIPTLHAAA